MVDASQGMYGESMVSDVCVIGAGVVGLFVAYELAKAGCSVTVVEKEDGPGRGVTSRQANVIHVIQMPFKSLRSRLCLEGNKIYRSRLVHELGIRIRETYAVIAATSLKGAAMLALVKPYLSAKLPQEHRPKLLRWRDAVELEPHLSDNVKLALAVPGYAVADYRDVVSKLVKALDELGVDQVYGEKVVSARVSADDVTIETSAGRNVKARLVINAAGLYSDEVAGLLGDTGYRIVPRKGVILVYGFTATRTIVASAEAPRGRGTKGGAVIPQLDGTTYVGPNLSSETVKGDYSYSSRDVESLVARFQPLLAVRLGKPVKTVVGLRPSTVHGDFIIEFGGRGRAVHLIGIESPGFTAAPAIAERVVFMAASRIKTCRALQR